MSDHKLFVSAFKQINKTIKTSTKQALKIAAKSTKTQYAKLVQEELGLKQAKIKKRAKIYPPTESGIVLSIATSIGIAASDFNTGKTAVNTRVGKRYQAYYRIKGAKQELPKGAFLTNINTLDTTKKLVLMRTGASQYPVTSVRVNVFLPVIMKNLDYLKSFMYQSFKKNFIAQFKYNSEKA